MIAVEYRLDYLIVPFGMPPAEEIQAINAALKKRGLHACDIISVRATGTPEDGIIVYFRQPFFLPFPGSAPEINERCEEHSIYNCPYCHAQHFGIDCPICLHRMATGK